MELSGYPRTQLRGKSIVKRHLAWVRELPAAEDVDGADADHGFTRIGAAFVIFAQSPTTLEGGVRVPYFVSWPGQIPAGITDDRPVIQLDVLPTALAAAGVEVKLKWKLDGVNLLPFLTRKDKGTPHEALYWRFGSQMAIRKGDWKLLKYDLAAENKTGTSPAKLYNVKDDMGEAHDLTATHPETVKELQAAWDQWKRANVAALWGGGAAK